MNRKGMIATLDAVIFVTGLALVSVTLMVSENSNDTSPDATEVCDVLTGMSMDSSDVTGDRVRINMSMWDYTAYCMVIGETDELENYLQDVLEDLLTGRYPFELTLEYRGMILTVGEGKGDPATECIRDVETFAGDSISIHLTVYK